MLSFLLTLFGTWHAMESGLNQRALETKGWVLSQRSGREYVSAISKMMECMEGAEADRSKLLQQRLYCVSKYSQLLLPVRNSIVFFARDYVGHGTHTLSTARGSFVLLGNGNGTARGWPPANDNECFDADIMAAFQAAIKDGVDVLLVSVGDDPSEFFKDRISIKAFHAVKNHEFTDYVALGNRKHLKGASLSSTGLPSQNFYH
ncbi:Peptidase S8, subtilisin-related [Trema orientale]|uniref:Peptidase S8, subtilisin-related n=1 Tax=Trema orientale TaxID=63057 RepID=A0A2P5FYI7_TREOI|nr:Peptidase S8, subtilisin-related [Trema orientale]